MRNENVIWYKGKRFVFVGVQGIKINCIKDCEYYKINFKSKKYRCPSCLPNERTDGINGYFKRETILKSLIKKMGI